MEIQAQHQQNHRQTEACRLLKGKNIIKNIREYTVNVLLRYKKNIVQLLKIGYLDENKCEIAE